MAVTTNTKETVAVGRQSKDGVNTLRIQKVIENVNTLRLSRKVVRPEDQGQGLLIDADARDHLRPSATTDPPRGLDIEDLAADPGPDRTTGDRLMTDLGDRRRGAEGRRRIRAADAGPGRGGPDPAVPDREGNEGQGHIVAGGVRGHTDTEISPPPLGCSRLYHF